MATAITSYAFNAMFPGSSMSCLESECVYVFLLKTYQQKSLFLCYRLPKIVVFSVQEFL